MGTNDYSATGLVDLLQNWIQSGKAYIVIIPFQMILDPTCPTRLDRLNDAECPVVPVEPHTGPTPIIHSKPDSHANQGIGQTTGNVQPQENHAASASTIGGFFVGGIIIILLLAVLVFIAMIAVKCFRNKSTTRCLLSYHG